MAQKYLRLNLLLIIFCVVSFVPLKAQPISWQNTIGGSGNDFIRSTSSTTDGGYIFAGFSDSDISADKSENNIGNYDMWIVKTDSFGNIEWENTIGGFASDVANSIQQTFDGGYIVAGYSESGISGDKTEGSHGDVDFWIVKLSPLGAIEWQNTIGGSDNDEAVSIKQTLDLGYIVVGSSLSGISGDKSEANKGAEFTSDYWVMKLDNAGNLLWENTIGGNNYDYAFTVEVTWDGGYIIGGYSQSGISGDKSEALIGSSDYWVIKLNHSGNIQWQNTIGGSGSDNLRKIIQDDDGGYIVAGYSDSDISGDKTEIAFGISADYWIVKLNSAGNIVWQNDIGGNDFEIAYDMIKLPEGGYGIFGITYSGVSGDKTEAGKGGSDYWYVEISSAGSLIDQNTIGGTNDEGGGGIALGDNGDIVLAGHSKSPLGEDKLENNKGPLSTYDFWIATFNPTCIPLPELCNTVDDDCDGLFDEDIIDSITIIAAGPTTICQGETVTLNATFTGTSVQWKRNGNIIPGATSATYITTQKGIYSCYTSSDCSNDESNTINIVVNKKPTAAITPGGPTSFCAGGNVTLNVTPVGGCSYQWYRGANPIAGATSINYVATLPGNYKCQVTKVSTGCFKNSNSIAVFVPCREGEEMKIQSTLFPNPATNTITINISISGYKKITLINTLGQTIQFIESEEVIVNLDINNIASGLYFIQVESEKNREVISFNKD